jgi:long-subunit fatty acid transport protein
MEMSDEDAANAGLPSGTTYGEAAVVYNTKAATASATAAQLGDKKVDVKQKGFGITPILGLNIKPVEALNIGLRYEFRTKLEMENETDEDGTGMFPDGETFRNDVPAILAAGADYQLFDNVRVSASYTNYFDKNANWDGKEESVDKNLYELALGMEYQLSDITAISAGYMHTKTGVGRGYQSDISFSLTGNSVGLGLMFKVNEKVDLDLGVLYTAYDSDYKEETYQSIAYKESYDKTNLVFSIGVSYHLFR